MTNLRLTPKAILNPEPVRATALLPTSMLLSVTFGGRTYCPSALGAHTEADKLTRAMVRIILSIMIIASVRQQHVILTHVLIPPPY